MINIKLHSILLAYANEKLLKYGIIKQINERRLGILENKEIIETLFKENYKVQNSLLLEKLVSCSQEVQFSKKRIILRSGNIPKYLFFLVNGVIRGFFFDREGKDITDCLFSSFGSAIWPSMSLDDAARIDLEALTDCTVIRLPVSEIQKLLQYPEVLIIYNRLLEHSLLYHWEIKTMMYQYNAQERYEWFLKKYPGVIDLISHKYIASFLGMNPVTLSRLRKFNIDEDTKH